MEIECRTLGSKHKKFYWSINQNDELIIRRIFENNISSVIVLTKEHIESLNDFVFLQSKIRLANNVEKLALGTEREGIGTFLMNNCGLNSSEAQIASQIAAILCEMEIWKSNGKERCIEVSTCKKSIFSDLVHCYELKISKEYN